MEVRSLTKAYGKNVALRGVSFTLETGKIYGLLGVNGAGKTTTLQLLAGYLEPSAGEVLINGLSMEKNAVKCKAQVGYLPEVPPLYPELTVEEFLRFQAELRGTPKGERRAAVEEAVQRGNLKKVRRRLIGQLSKGFRQRVGIAAVLMGEPEILLLDEPTNGLDPLQIVTMREMLISLREKHTLVVSSHVLSEIEQLADEFLIIADGRLVLQGDRETLLEGKDMTLEQLFLDATRAAYAEAAAGEAEEEKEEDEEEEDEEDSEDY